LCHADGHVLGGPEPDGSLIVGQERSRTPV
jgi:hypothetical protein